MKEMVFELENNQTTCLDPAIGLTMQKHAQAAAVTHFYYTWRGFRSDVRSVVWQCLPSIEKIQQI
jgi:hypothetical protein